MSVFVSIIIPSYNHAPFLTHRINSILLQTYQNYEIIILDDNSSDSSRDIIETYRENKKVTHIIYNDKNLGNTFLQWKKGIEIARGEWIWIAESDDYCEITFLEELIQGVTKDQNCVLGYCQSIMFRDNEILWVSSSSHLQAVKNGPSFIKEHMLLGNSIFNASMCIFKKEMYKNVSQEFTKYKFSGDWLFWTEIALQGNVYISGKNLNYFRKHNDDVSSKAFSNGLVYTEYFDLIAIFQTRGLVSKHKAQYLIKEKYKKFLFDKSLTGEFKKEILCLFNKKVGFINIKTLIWFGLRTLNENIKRLFRR